MALIGQCFPPVIKIQIVLMCCRFPVVSNHWNTTWKKPNCCIQSVLFHGQTANDCAWKYQCVRVSVTVRVQHFHEVDPFCCEVMCNLVRCQTHVLCRSREIIPLFFVSSEVDAQEMKREGEYCILGSIQFYICVRDDLKSMTVPLYLKGAPLF